MRARKDLLTHRVGLANQLRAHLESHYPGPVGLFAPQCICRAVGRATAGRPPPVSAA